MFPGAYWWSIRLRQIWPKCPTPVLLGHPTLPDPAVSALYSQTSLASNMYFLTSYDAKGTKSHVFGVVESSVEMGFCGQTMGKVTIAVAVLPAVATEDCLYLIPTD